MFLEIPSLNDISVLVEKNVNVNNIFKTVVIVVFNGPNMVMNSMVLQLGFGDNSSPIVITINSTNSQTINYTFFYRYGYGIIVIYSFLNLNERKW